MIFCSKNEDEVPAWELVLKGKKTVTRRKKPLEVGKVFAVQPNRCKKAVCRAKVISCVKHLEWSDKNTPFDRSKYYKILKDEAHKEGFEEWIGLLDWFDTRNIDINETYRIEFEVILSVIKRAFEHKDL